MGGNIRALAIEIKKKPASVLPPMSVGSIGSSVQNRKNRNSRALWECDKQRFRRVCAWCGVFAVQSVVSGRCIVSGVVSRVVRCSGRIRVLSSSSGQVSEGVLQHYTTQHRKETACARVRQSLRMRPGRHATIAVSVRRGGQEGDGSQHELVEVALDDHVLNGIHGDLEQVGVGGVCEVAVDLLLRVAVQGAELVEEVLGGGFGVGGVADEVGEAVLGDGVVFDLGLEEIHLVEEEDQGRAREPLRVGD